MKKDLEIFFEKLLTEKEFREKFIATQSAKEGYEMAKPYLEGVSFDECKEGLIEMHRKFINRSYKEMTDEDLSGVSGGAIRESYIDIFNYLSKNIF